MSTFADRPAVPSHPASGRRGLTGSEAAARLVQHGPNALPPARRSPLVARLWRELREPMAMLLVGAAAVSGILLGEVVEAVAIVAIVVVNAVISLVQEGRATRAMDALEEMEAPTATVVRDGRRRVLAARELVPGDLTLLQAGDRVPADLLVVDSDGLQVDEGVLTGESLPASKSADGTTDRALPLGDQHGRLFSGTLVTRGAGWGTVTETGPRTALGAIAVHLSDVRREPTPLQRQLEGLTRRLGIAAVVIAAVTFVVSVVVVRSMGTDEAFLTAVALAVAAVPEGLAAVTTVALALGVGRMARRGAIVRRLPAVETLGAADVLVIDKTGTVTENRMRVQWILTPDGDLAAPATILDGSSPMFSAVLALCNDATLDPPTGDPTERALLALVGEEQVQVWSDTAPRSGVAAFTSDRRRMATLHRLHDRWHLLAKGAPEVLVPRCADASRGGTTSPLTDDDREDLLARVEVAAAQGQRVLAVAWRALDRTPETLEDEEHDLVLEGFVILRDPPRAAAGASVRAARDAGIRLVMATGDHPATAAGIADEVGIGGEVVATGTQIRASGLANVMANVDVLARVDPDQKLDLVAALQAEGHVVAMTGDGVNDAPALQRADIGVALGGTGSDVAREAADVVITDDDLATIVAAIHEGRTIHDNLRKVIDYLVASNLSEVMVVLVVLLAVPSLGVPLFPLQLLWINLLTDGLPALALGVDPAHPGVMARPPRDPSRRLLDAPHLRHLAGRGAAMALGAVGALLVAEHVLHLPSTAARTVLFSTLVVAQAVYAWVVRRHGIRGKLLRNPWLVTSTLASLALQLLVVSVPILASVFDTVALSFDAWTVVVLGGLAGPMLIVASASRRDG